MKPISSAKIRRSPVVLDAQTPTDRGGSPASSALRPTRAKMPKRPSRALHPPDQLFTDHVQADERRPLARRDVALGLEQAAQVRGDDRQRRGEQALAGPPDRRRGHAGPSGSRSRQATFPYSRVRRQSKSSRWVWTRRSWRCTPGKTASRASVTQASSASVTSLPRCQRPVRPVVLADEPVGLQPTGQRGLGNIAGTDLRLAERRPPVPFQRVARRAARRPRTNRPVPSPVLRHTRWSAVTSRVCPALVCSRSTSLMPLRLVASDRGDAVCVVDLGAHRVVSTSSPIGTSPAGVLTSASYGWHADDLLRGLGADVEPDRAS